MMNLRKWDMAGKELRLDVLIFLDVAGKVNGFGEIRYLINPAQGANMYSRAVLQPYFVRPAQPKNKKGF